MGEAIANLDSEAPIRAKDVKPILAWIGTALGGLALGAAGFAHGKLWSHETDIAVLKTTGEAKEKRLDGIETKLDKILDELRRK